MRHAIFTIVQDEPFFFPLWCKYYREHYASQNIYVLYHSLPGEESGDPSWLRTPMVLTSTSLVRVFRDTSFDHTWLREQVERFATFLLGSYDTVTFTEVDEIITPNPGMGKGRILTQWLDDWCLQEQPAVRCTGYEVVHRFNQEPGVDRFTAVMPTGRILENRGWWYPSSIYSKTLTWRVPPHWGNGFHQAYTYFADATGRYATLDLPKEPELLLLHLHKVDYQVALARLRRTAARNWHDADTQGQIGIQNRFKDEQQLGAWWYKNIDNPSVDAPLVSIPAAVRDVI